MSGAGGAELARWQRRLEAVAASSAAPLIDRVLVLEDVGSTQDAAASCPAGIAVVALRQRSGRGRLGSSWEDTAEAGVAMTIVTAPGPPERMAIASAVAAAEALQQFVAAAIHLKWPNDVLIHGRKAAGILIEQDGRAARVGVGVNVAHRAWPAPLHGRAVSLAEAGARCDRLDVAAALLGSFAAAHAAPDDVLAGAFRSRDVLVGTVAAFMHGRQRLTGRVLELDPMRGLVVEVDGRRLWLPAATTRLCGDAYAGADAGGKARSNG